MRNPMCFYSGHRAGTVRAPYGHRTGTVRALRKHDCFAHGGYVFYLFGVRPLEMKHSNRMHLSPPCPAQTLSVPGPSLRISFEASSNQCQVAIITFRMNTGTLYGGWVTVKGIMFLRCAIAPVEMVAFTFSM